MATKMHVGVAGWNYPDWRETVYRLPGRLRQPELFQSVGVEPEKASYAADDLRFLAGYLDMIEINSSFYRIPSQKATADWARRIDSVPGFFFTAKLNRQFTHDFQRSSPLAADFRRAFQPLCDAERLRGVLAQFRYDVADSPETRSLLAWIAAEFDHWIPLVVEVRHSSWGEPPALEFLRNLGITVANLDYPGAKTSFDLQDMTLGPTPYLRLHGQNRTAWFSRSKAGYEPYNYDYTDTEVTALAQRSRKLMTHATALTIVANNHYQGKAVSAALRLKAALLQENVPVPPALLETYPSLKRIALSMS